MTTDTPPIWPTEIRTGGHTYALRYHLRAETAHGMRMYLATIRIDGLQFLEFPVYWKGAGETPSKAFRRALDAMWAELDPAS